MAESLVSRDPEIMSRTLPGASATVCRLEPLVVVVERPRLFAQRLVLADLGLRTQRDRLAGAKRPFPALAGGRAHITLDGERTVVL